MVSISLVRSSCMSRLRITDLHYSAMFGKVDARLGESIKKVTETKIEGSHAHPHKTAWH
jgi:hypothetical protein